MACESEKCGWSPKNTLTIGDKEQLRDIRKQIVKIVEMVDSLVLADANRDTIDTFLSRQLESIARIVRK